MDKLEQAYELLNGDETDVKKAEQLYLEVYKNIKSTQSEKAEAASQLGYIYFGDFDDVDEDVVLKDLVKAKNFFKQSIAKGNKDDALTLSQIYCKDANSMTEEIEFAISTLLNEKMYENEAIDAIDIYVKKLFVNNVTKLLNLYNKLSSYQSKIENQKIISRLIAHKKKISITVAELLLLNIKSVKDCKDAKRILFDINDDNIVGKVIGEINTRIIELELKDFNDISKVSSIENVINKFNRRDSYDLYNLFSDLLNLKLAISYAYGINKAQVDYFESMRYFSKICNVDVIDYADEELEKLIRSFVNQNNFDLAHSFANLLNNNSIRAQYKGLLSKKEEAIKFYKVIEKVNSGDVNAKFILASYYLTGYGVEANKDKAVELYKELYFTVDPKRAFDQLFNILKGNELTDLLIDAKNKKIDFNKEQQDKYDRLFNPKPETPKPIQYETNEIYDLFYESPFKSMSQSDRELLAKELEKRGITRLVHFTFKSNLEGIKKTDGILSRRQLSKHPEIKYSVTDDNRIDNIPDGISVSITTPNLPMLKQKIREGKIVDPYIIVLRADILLDPNIRFIFCESNASRFDKNKGCDFKSFLRMFQETDPIIFTYDGMVQSKTRSELHRASNQTTDIQAEILVEGKIPKNYILNI